MCVRCRNINSPYQHTHTHIQACMWAAGVFCPGRAVEGSWEHPLPESRINHRALEQLGLACGTNCAWDMIRLELNIVEYAFFFVSI